MSFARAAVLLITLVSAGLSGALLGRAGREEPPRKLHTLFAFAGRGIGGSRVPTIYILDGDDIVVPGEFQLALRSQVVVHMRETDAQNINALAWAPDGQTIYFTAARREQRDTLDLWRVRVDGTRLERVETDAFDFTWGYRYALPSMLAISDDGEVYTKIAPSGGMLRLDEEPGGVSPDGRRIAVRARAIDSGPICVGDVGEPRQEWTCFGDAFFTAPAWAPFVRQ